MPDLLLGVPENPMTLFEKLEAEGHAALTAIEHGAVKLVGWLATISINLSALTGSSSLVQEALAEGIRSAEAHGIPATAISSLEEAGSEVLHLATQFASSLSAPAPFKTVPVPGHEATGFMPPDAV